MKHIESTSHTLVKHWVRLQNDKAYRQATGKVLVEGKNLLHDLIARHRPLALIVTERQRPFFTNFSGEVITISDHVASKISSVEHPEGCYAEYSMPAVLPQPQAQRTVILDGLQDPGNVGTIFRTCLAFDVRSIGLVEPCCDPWNPKVVRAAKGAMFDLTITPCLWSHCDADPPLLVADPRGMDIRQLPPCSAWRLVLGNEAHGHRVPPTLHPIHVKIPMPGPMESLNVAQAGAILLYALVP